MTENKPAPVYYANLLTDIKQRIRHAQTRAWFSVNAELIRLYWEIGALIDTRQRQEGWGACVIPRLACDLHNELPEEKGFSERNIKRMLAFYRQYSDLAFVPQAVAQIESKAEVPQAAALFTPVLILAVPYRTRTGRPAGRTRIMNSTLRIFAADQLATPPTTARRLSDLGEFRGKQEVRSYRDALAWIYQGAVFIDG